MNEQKHTPTPWRAGKFLDLPQYRNMPDNWKNEMALKESREIYANFTAADQGRNRILIATVSDYAPEANRDLIIRAVNSHAALVEALDKFEEWWRSLPLDSRDKIPHHGIAIAAVRMARAALDLARQDNKEGGK